MKTNLVAITLVVIGLAPSAGHADEYRYFATALEARLKSLDVEKQKCGSGVRVANQQAWETVDRVERRAYRDPRGGFTSREKAQLEQAQGDLDSAVDDALTCEKRIETDRAYLRAILADPARLRLESDKQKNELQYELRALLADVRSASAMLGAETMYDEFGRKMSAVGSRLHSIRSKYGIPLGRGDHKALGVPISDACNALYVAGGEWKRARQAAHEMAGTQAAIGPRSPLGENLFRRTIPRGSAETRRSPETLGRPESDGPDSDPGRDEGGPGRGADGAGGDGEAVAKGPGLVDHRAGIGGRLEPGQTSSACFPGLRLAGLEGLKYGCF
jgi:hypothetical protein